jgi:hypothetical protein
MKIAGTVFLLLFSATPAAAIDKYICVGDQATGFHWNGKAWAPATFRADDTKYLVTDLDPKSDESAKGRFTVAVVPFGERTPSFACEELLSLLYRCQGFYGQMSLNLSTLRWSSYYPHGYVNGEDNNKDNPAITIGRCSKL